MATANYTTAIGNRPTSPIWILTIEGIGDSGGLWKFSTRTPTYGGSQYTALLRGAPQLAGEKLAPIQCRTDIGELTATLVDQSDLLTGFCGWCAEPVDEITTDGGIADVDASCTVHDGSQFAINDIIYVGQEAIQITNVATNTLSLSRGKLGTTATAHSRYDDIYTSPPYLRDRVVKLYLGQDSLTADDETLVWSGYLDELELDEDMNSFTLSARASLAGTKRKAFYKGVGWSGKITRVMGFGDLGLAFSFKKDPTYWLPTYEFTSDEPYLYVRIDDEIVGLGNAGETYGDATSRGVLETEIETHGMGAQITEIAVTDPTLNSQFRYQTPGSEGAGQSWTKTGHPIHIFLALLTSPAYANQYTALGTGGWSNYSSGYGNYASLPRGWGIGTSQSDIDWDSVRGLLARYPDLTTPNFIFDEARELKELAEQELLGPFGIYLYTNESGKLAIGSTAAPLPLDSTTALTTADISSRPQQTGNLGQTVTRVSYTVPRLTGEPDQYHFHDSDFSKLFQARTMFAGEQGSIEWECPGLARDAGEKLKGLAAALLTRYRKPLATLQARVGFNRHLLTIGSVLSVTYPQLLNPRTAARGWTSELCQLLGLTLQDDCSVLLDLLWYGTGGQYRHIAPAGIVSSWTAATKTLVLQSDNQFSPATTYGFVPAEDISSFTAGHAISVYTTAMVARTSQQQRIATVTAGTHTMTFDEDTGWTGGNAPQAGDIVICAAYGGAIADQKSTYAFLADEANRTIGASSDTPHQYCED